MKDLKIGQKYCIKDNDGNYTYVVITNLENGNDDLCRTVSYDIADGTYTHIVEDLDEFISMVVDSDDSETEIKRLKHTFSFVEDIGKPTQQLIGRDDIIDKIIESTYKTRMKNVLLVGNAGCGKTEIIKNVAKKISDRFYVLTFNCGDAVGGTKYRGEFEEKISKALKEIKYFNKKSNNKKIILFIDEFHACMNLGGAEGAVSFSNIIKPYLSDSDIIIYGATTEMEYSKYVAYEHAMCRRMGIIKISDLSDDVVKVIVKNFGKNKISSNIANYIVDKSSNLFGINPDLSIEIADRSLAKSKYKKVPLTEDIVNAVCETMETKSEHNEDNDTLKSFIDELKRDESRIKL